mmetsp:Transcript_2528/g.6041  ORF Transcript_2528/g.6041 Transcript_2528/m.6041 type:complete len:625 (+) Transcript_2528:13-1887(+)
MCHACHPTPMRSSLRPRAESLAFPAFAALSIGHKALAAEVLALAHVSHGALHLHAHAAHAAHATAHGPTHAHVAHGPGGHHLFAKTLSTLGALSHRALSMVRSAVGDLQLRRLVTHVHQERPMPSALFGNLYEDLGVLDLLVQQGLQDFILVHKHAILGQIYKLCLRLNTVVLENQLLLVVSVVVERQVLQHDALPVRILAILLEGMRHQVELEAQNHQCPVLRAKLFVQGHPATDVIDLINTKNVNAIEIHLLFFLLFLLDLHGLNLFLLHLILFLFLLLFGFLFILLRLLCSRLGFCELLLGLFGLFGRRLLLHLGLVLGDLGLPLLEDLLPSTDLSLEPRRWNQVLHSARELPVLDPLRHDFRGLVLLRPFVLDLVKALVGIRHGELGEARVQDNHGHIRCRHLAVFQLLLLCGQLYLRRLFVHFFHRLFLIFLLFHLNVLGLVFLFFWWNLLALGFEFLSFCLLFRLILCFLHLFQLLHALLISLLLRLLQLFLPLFSRFLPGLLFFLHLELLVRLFLLVLQHQLQAHLLEVSRRLTDHDHGHFLKGAVKEAAQTLGPAVLHQVGPKLHNDVMALLKRSHGLDHAPDAHVLHLLDAEPEVRSVVACQASDWCKTALLCPI